MSQTTYTAVFMDHHTPRSDFFLEQSHQGLNARVFNKPLLDHHLEALAQGGITKTIVLSSKLTAGTFRSEGAAYKQDVAFQKTLSPKDIITDGVMILSANSYTHFDVEYVLAAAADANSSRILPLENQGVKSAFFTPPLILNPTALQQLFSQVNVLDIHTMQVLLDHFQVDQDIPTSMLMGSPGTPNHEWHLHQRMHSAGLSANHPAGYEHQPGLWSGWNLRLNDVPKIDGLVIAGRNVVIKEGVTFSGWVVLGDGVFIDAGAHLENCIIKSGSYVGQRTRIENAVVNGHRLHRVDRGVSLDIPDQRILGRTGLMNWLSKRQKGPSRILGLTWKPTEMTVQV